MHGERFDVNADHQCHGRQPVAFSLIVVLCSTGPCSLVSLVVMPSCCLAQRGSLATRRPESSPPSTRCHPPAHYIVDVSVIDKAGASDR